MAGVVFDDLDVEAQESEPAPEPDSTPGQVPHQHQPDPLSAQHGQSGSLALMRAFDEVQPEPEPVPLPEPRPSKQRTTRGESRYAIQPDALLPKRSITQKSSRIFPIGRGPAGSGHMDAVDASSPRAGARGQTQPIHEADVQSTAGGGVGHQGLRCRSAFQNWVCSVCLVLFVSAVAWIVVSIVGKELIPRQSPQSCDAEQAFCPVRREVRWPPWGSLLNIDGSCVYDCSRQCPGYDLSIDQASKDDLCKPREAASCAASEIFCPASRDCVAAADCPNCPGGGHCDICVGYVIEPSRGIGEKNDECLKTEAASCVHPAVFCPSNATSWAGTCLLSCDQCGGYEMMPVLGGTVIQDTCQSVQPSSCATQAIFCPDTALRLGGRCITSSCDGCFGYEEEPSAGLGGGNDTCASTVGLEDRPINPCGARLYSEPLTTYHRMYTEAIVNDSVCCPNSNTCIYADDGVCDEPSLCPDRTDGIDCNRECKSGSFDFDCGSISPRSAEYACNGHDLMRRCGARGECCTCCGSDEACTAAARDGIISNISDYFRETGESYRPMVECKDSDERQSSCESERCKLGNIEPSLVMRDQCGVDACDLLGFGSYPRKWTGNGVCDDDERYPYTIEATGQQGFWEGCPGKDCTDCGNCCSDDKWDVYEALDDRDRNLPALDRLTQAQLYATETCCDCGGGEVVASANIGLYGERKEESPRYDISETPPPTGSAETRLVSRPYGRIRLTLLALVWATWVISAAVLVSMKRKLDDDCITGMKKGHSVFPACWCCGTRCRKCRGGRVFWCDSTDWPKVPIRDVGDHEMWYAEHHFKTSGDRQWQLQLQQHAQWLATHALYDWVTSAEVGCHRYRTIAASSGALTSKRRLYVCLVSFTCAVGSVAFAVATTIATSFVSGVQKPVVSLLFLGLYLWLVNLLTRLLMYASVRKVVHWWNCAIPAQNCRGKCTLAEDVRPPPQWYSLYTFWRLAGMSAIPTGVYSLVRLLVCRCCCRKCPSTVPRTAFDMFHLADLACSTEVALTTLHCQREDGSAVEQSLYRISRLLFQCCEHIEWTFLYTRCFSAFLCTALPWAIVYVTEYDEDDDLNLADWVVAAAVGWSATGQMFALDQSATNAAVAMICRYPDNLAFVSGEEHGGHGLYGTFTKGGQHWGSICAGRKWSRRDQILPRILAHCWSEQEQPSAEQLKERIADAELVFGEDFIVDHVQKWLRWTMSHCSLCKPQKPRSLTESDAFALIQQYVADNSENQQVEIFTDETVLLRGSQNILLNLPKLEGKKLRTRLAKKKDLRDSKQQMNEVATLLVDNGCWSWQLQEWTGAFQNLLKQHKDALVMSTYIVGQHSPEWITMLPIECNYPGYNGPESGDLTSYDIFISYRWLPEHKPVARSLFKWLNTHYLDDDHKICPVTDTTKEKDRLKVFWDNECLPEDGDPSEHFIRAVSTAKVAVLLLSHEVRTVRNLSL
eukprot:COSAG02_NODE_362_length_23815_cov_27.096981_7_plen_1462_part_00